MQYLLTAVVLMIGICSCAGKPADEYSTEHDDLDIEAIAADENQLRSYLKCFQDLGPCDDVQAHFKKDIPEAIKEACKKCTASQKHILKRFLEASESKLPNETKEFQKKFDPDTKLFPALALALAGA